MFNKFTVITKTINMSDGESVTWVNKDTEKEARDKFFDECSTVGGNPQTKACEVIVLNPNGNILRIEPIDNEQYTK